MAKVNGNSSATPLTADRPGSAPMIEAGDRADQDDESMGQLRLA